MEKRAQIVIVSTYGRGLWLTEKLASLGMDIILVDVSEQIRAFEPMYWEGPFIVSPKSFQDESQLEHIKTFYDLKKMEQGFTFLLENGPLELQGPLSEFQFQKYNIPNTVKEYLSWTHNKKQSGSFNDIWLSHFAHQFSSTVFKVNSKGQSWSGQAPMMTDCYIPKLKHNHFYENLEKYNTKIFLNSKLTDISINHKVIDGLEISSDRAGVITGDLFLWFLGNEETTYLNSNLSSQLFYKIEKSPSWYWEKARIEIEEAVELSTLPDYFVMVQNLKLSWVASNLTVFKRAEKENLFDIWMRVPARLTEPELKKLFITATKNLQEKVSPLKIKLLKEHFATNKPPLFPVLLEKDWRRRQPKYLQNVFFDNYELWSSFDLSEQYRFQSKLLTDIIDWFEKKGKKLNDRSIHKTPDGANLDF